MGFMGVMGTLRKEKGKGERDCSSGYGVKTEQRWRGWKDLADASSCIRYGNMR